MASTDAKPIPLKNTAYRHYFAIRKNDGTLITSWTSPSGVISQDGGTMAVATNWQATEIATNSGTGYIELTAGEMNNDCVVLKVTVTNTDALPYIVSLFPEEAGDIRVNVTEINDDASSASNLQKSSSTIVQGTVTNNNFTPTTTAFHVQDITEATADHYNGRIVIFTSGDLQNQATDVTDYELSSGDGKFTVTALTEAPASGNTFVIV